MTIRANPFRALPILVAFFLNVVVAPVAPFAQSALVSAAPGDGIEDYAQCQIGDGAGLDCSGPPETPAAWTNGILNDTHNDYSEDEVVPQRLQMEFEPNTSHSVTIRYMTRKDSSGQRHAYDYLATWNYTYINADRCEDLPSGLDCIGGSADTLDIPSDPNSVTPVGTGISAVTADHELPQADRQFVLYGGTFDGPASTPVHAVDPNEAGSDYASITVSFTVGAGGQMQLLWGGHLASGFGPRGWGENLGAASISGGPYHMIVDAVDGESIGQRDNQIMSNAIQPLLPTLDIDKTPDGGTVTAGDYASFTITVTNNGPGTATNVDIDDTLPAGSGATTLVWAEFPDAAECTVVSNVLHCDIASLAVGASFSVTVRALTDGDDCGLLPNLAYADADNNPQVSDPGDITVLCPDLTAIKQADDEVVSAGEEIAFTITVSNSDAAGTGTAYGVELEDLLPFKADGTVDWEIDPANADCEITGAIGSQVLHCEFGDLEPGDSVSVRVESGTTEEDCALYHNQADITSTNHEELNPTADTTVECPGLNIAKTAGPSPIDAGEDASFTVTVWNNGPGTAFDVTVHDELPAGVDWGKATVVGGSGEECGMTSSQLPGEPAEWSFDCELGDLAVTDMAGGVQIVISGTTDREDCGLLLNQAWADASNSDKVGPAEATIEVRCPTVEILKVNDQPDPVLPGTVVSYALTVTVSDGPADDVVVTDLLPLGLDAPTNISDAGTYEGGTRTITWNLGDLADGSYELTYQAAVSLDAGHGDELVNLAVVTSPNSQCPDAENVADECDDTSGVTVRVPTLVIDKAADTETVRFVFDAEGNVLSVDPEEVTWTLTYTLTNGPVTNAVITDPLPDFLTFVSASDGGVYDAATGTITWELGTLTASGSVSFVTTVDADAPETEPIVNVATIISDQTPSDDGEDEIRVTSESEQGGTPSPSPSVPDTALVIAPSGTPLTIPVELMVTLFATSLGALAFANVRAVRRRR